jgi:formylglycine-generating enzyme required for sulfatase activity
MVIELKPGARPLPGYRLEARLGRGGFGEVWRAVAPGGFKVALKFVQLCDSLAPRELQAIEIMKDIRYPNVLALFGAWCIDNYLMIAMELADGTLMDRFAEVVRRGHRGIAFHELIDQMEDAAKGIDYLNTPRHQSESGELRSVQHRDIKPQNLLLVGGGVKVGDFGLLRFMSHSISGSSAAFTPSYAPPEFFNNQTSIYSDQYSLAVTYCQLRGGRLPFEGLLEAVMNGHLHHAPDLTMLPDAEQPAVARALAKDPSDRWPNCRAFVDALRQIGRSDCLAMDAPFVAAIADESPSTPKIHDTKTPIADTIVNSIGMTLVRIHAGSFAMGSPASEEGRDENEGPRHGVTITRPFYMGIHPVTQREYESVVGSNPAHFADFAGGGPDHPVEQVTWDRAVEFCRRLSDLADEKQSRRRYRLPTEAEWEYACRAGTTTAFNIGSSLSSDAANIDGRIPYGGSSVGRCLHRTTKIGTYRANRFGLHDMHGNVWEWCADWYDGHYYQECPQHDPLGPATGDFRILRGGSWEDSAKHARSAVRLRFTPDHHNQTIGFRVVMDYGVAGDR